MTDIDKEPLQDIIDDGLDAFFEAIHRAASNQPDHHLDKTGDRDPLSWYVRGRLHIWQQTTHTETWMFTEYHGGVLMPASWQRFLEIYTYKFCDRDTPTVSQVAGWLESEEVQEVLAYDRRVRVILYVSKQYFDNHQSTVEADAIAEKLKLTLDQVIETIEELVSMKRLIRIDQKDGKIPLVRSFLKEDKAATSQL